MGVRKGLDNQKERVGREKETEEREKDELRNPLKGHGH